MEKTKKNEGQAPVQGRASDQEGEWVVKALDDTG